MNLPDGATLILLTDHQLHDLIHEAVAAGRQDGAAEATARLTPETLTTPEAARALGVSENTLRTLYPELGIIRIGTRVRIPRANLLAYQEAQRYRTGRRRRATR